MTNPSPHAAVPPTVSSVLEEIEVLIPTLEPSARSTFARAVFERALGPRVRRLQRNIVVLVGFLVLVSVLASWALAWAERGRPLGDFETAVYTVLISLFTVGLGAYAPETSLGRVIIVVVGGIGLLSFGVFVSYLTALVDAS